MCEMVVLRKAVSKTLCRACLWLITGYEMSKEDNMGDKPHCNNFGVTLDYRKDKDRSDEHNRQFNSAKRCDQCKKKYPGAWDITINQTERSK